MAVKDHEGETPKSLQNGCFSRLSLRYLGHEKILFSPLIERKTHHTVIRDGKKWAQNTCSNTPRGLQPTMEKLVLYTFGPTGDAQNPDLAAHAPPLSIAKMGH